MQITPNQGRVVRRNGERADVFVFVSSIVAICRILSPLHVLRNRFCVFISAARRRRQHASADKTERRIRDVITSLLPVV